MGVEKYVLKPGNGTDVPQKNDKVAMEYTGWLYDEDAPDQKGKQYVYTFSHDHLRLRKLEVSNSVCVLLDSTHR